MYQEREKGTKLCMKRKTRPTVVEMHPNRRLIEQELAEGVPIRTLSERYNIHRSSLERYKKNRLPDELVKAAKQRDITSANELFSIILKTVQRMEKLSDSCDEYLKDPDNPGLYHLGPQAEEIQVVYKEEITLPNGEERIVRKKDSLQDLLFRLEEHEISPTELRGTQTDPRILLVKSSDMLTKQMDMLVQAWKNVDQGKTNLFGSETWQKAIEVILTETQEYPEIRRRIADGLTSIGAFSSKS
jgi:5'-deoxynucleotidase YfbR-like HD superfamily hydrolase